MNNFCSRCGAQISEGQPCGCSSSSEGNISIASNSKDFVQTLKNMLHFGLSVLKQPSNTMHTTVVEKSDFKLGLMYLGLQTILSALVALFSALSLQRSLGLFGSSVSPGDTVFKVILAVIFQFAILSGVVFATSKVIAKSPVSFQTVVNIVGISSIPISLAVLVASILFMIKLSTLGVLVFIPCLIFSVFLNYFGLRSALKASDDKVIYVLMIGYLGCSLVFNFYNPMSILSMPNSLF